MTPPRQYRGRRRPASSASFTLVEILAALTVLAIIVVVASRLISLTSRTIVSDGKQIDALSQTRSALDRFGLDWNAHVTRLDVALAISKSAGNDSIAFVSQMPARTGTRSLAAIGYRVNANATNTGSNYRLERGAQGFDWAGGNPIAFPLSALPAIAETNFQALSAGVFRLEICALTRATSTNAAVLTASPASPLTDTITNYAAILVAVAALDDASRKLVDSSKLALLVAALPDATDASPDPAAAWKAALNAPGFAVDAGVPPLVAQAIRVDERYFYVNMVP